MRPMPRPSPSANRPPVSRCMVVANDAVMSGWRVVWLVAAVAMPRLVEAAPTAPESAQASFTFQRSEMNTLPRPSASASRTSSMSARGESAPPARV